ncbi:MAG: hypothetical protein KGY45_00970 [Hadesarchaea archaeon]|nr:hypothetical protein [Hadesarchaea archaeon]
MTKSQRELNFQIKDSEHLIKIVEGLTNINADIDAESDPSTIKITIYGSKEKIKQTSKKIRSLVEEAKSS